jgi:hypothetical protein
VKIAAAFVLISMLFPPAYPQEKQEVGHTPVIYQIEGGQICEIQFFRVYAVYRKVNDKPVVYQLVGYVRVSHDIHMYVPDPSMLFEYIPHLVDRPAKWNCSYRLLRVFGGRRGSGEGLIQTSKKLIKELE